MPILLANILHSYYAQDCSREGCTLNLWENNFVSSIVYTGMFSSVN